MSKCEICQKTLSSNKEAFCFYELYRTVRDRTIYILNAEWENGYIWTFDAFYNYIEIRQFGKNKNNNSENLKKLKDEQILKILEDYIPKKYNSIETLYDFFSCVKGVEKAFIGSTREQGHPVSATSDDLKRLLSDLEFCGIDRKDILTTIEGNTKLKSYDYFENHHFIEPPSEAVRRLKKY